jgi:hypothetical protein
MSSLHPDLRKRLRDVVLEARRVAEKGADQALRALAVDTAEPVASMSAEKKRLRIALRARGRQLGDAQGRDGKQDLDHLGSECAYEQWHRMLFARFLAENHLLLHPEGVPVTLDEVRELAAAETPPVEMWVLAARWAARMLPALFRPDDPVLAVDLAAEHRTKLEGLLAGLPGDVFTADDGLGWVYQFWQEEKKDAVNRSEVKIGADELPAVTQLFTEPYMVKFLLHNTLGAWWIGRHGGKPPIEMEFLRTNEDGAPAAGTFPEWPTRTADLKCLDPCCGSGHFLVEMLKILVAFRMKEEKLGAGEAVDAVLRENLFGLEIDPRCTQIAAFALALQAWKLAGGYRPLPADGLHVACCGIAPRAKKHEWLQLAGGDEKLRNGLERLHDLFKDAPTLGSLIDPTREDGELFAAGWGELQPLLAKALAGEKKDEEARELGVAARGIAVAAEILAGRYSLVATNVPYLARTKCDQLLVSFCDTHFPEAKENLATVFVTRTLSFCESGGTSAVVTAQNWLFLGSYTALRRKLTLIATPNAIIRLGVKAFSTPMWDLNIAMTVVTRSKPNGAAGVLFGDVAEEPTSAEKGRRLIVVPTTKHLLKAITASPGCELQPPVESEGEFLERLAGSFQGIKSGDDGALCRKFWELTSPKGEWSPLQSTVSTTTDYGGMEGLVHIPGKQRAIARLQGLKAWGRRGIAVSQMGSLPVALYCGTPFDSNVSVLVPHDERDLPALWAYCSTPAFREDVREVDQSLKVTNSSFLRVRFSKKTWEPIAHKQYPHGLPLPYSEDPTQWIFKGTVVPSTDPLLVAIARLLGYRWPDQEKDDLDALADRDGIVCIPPVGGEPPAADRLRAVLAKAYGRKWKASIEGELLGSVGYEGKSLDEWLRDGFFEQHCKLFHHRPFIWHIWDGRKKDGFHALVNYHRLDHRLLEKLTFTTLGSWIQQLRQAEKKGEATAEARIAAAVDLQTRLEAILEGENPYDIFVRWKLPEEQPIGWEPDLNDGVRLNIRPFATAEVLRKKPNVKWEKDRGKNPPGAPWGEERLNDLHLSLEKKRAARRDHNGRKEARR